MTSPVDDRHLFLFLCLLLPVVICRAAPGSNLLLNGDFEAREPGPWEKRTPDDKDRALSVPAGAAHSGSQGARIINSEAVSSRWRQGAGGTIKAPAGAMVRLAGWIRTDLGTNGHAALRLYFMDKGGAILSQPQTTAVRGKSNWRRASLRGPIPEGSDHLMVYLELANGVGTADYDDITLNVIPGDKPRPPLNDLAMWTDAPPDDSVVASLRALYPDRLVVVPAGETPPWDGCRGAVVFARGPDIRFDFDAIEAAARRGCRVALDLGVYARMRGARVREIVSDSAPSLRVVRECRETRGFAAGDSIPWHGGATNRWTQRVLDGVDRGKVLAESSEGGALVVIEAVGKGALLGTDLAGLPEPLWNRPGSLNKYLFAGNALGDTVRYGRHYPRRLGYAEFVEAMRALAAECPGWRVEEEGPASGGYSIFSLNIGDARRETFLIYAATHGSEWEPAYGLLTLARVLSSEEGAKLPDTGRYALKLVPIVNPSGYDRSTRQNAAGVDLNRNGDQNWEAFTGRDSNKDGQWAPGDYDWKGAGPCSESETQTFRAICGRTRLRAALDFHGNSGGPGNNRIAILPVTAREDNEERAEAAVCAFNAAMRNRYALQQANRPGVAQYDIETVRWSEDRPMLNLTACRGRYGFLVEVPAGYAGTYGLVMQTDIVIETCLAFLKTYHSP